MNTLNKLKLHTPNVQAISTGDDEQFTFCEDCEQNIERFFFYDDDCGWRDSNWFISGQNPNTSKVCVA